MLALVGGVPEMLPLGHAGALRGAIAERVVKLRTEYDCGRPRSASISLLGLSKALDHIDEVIAVIKKAADIPLPHRSRSKRNLVSPMLQAAAILEMRLSKLAGLERKKIEDELSEDAASLFQH